MYSCRATPSSYDSKSLFRGAWIVTDYCCVCHGKSFIWEITQHCSFGVSSLWDSRINFKLVCITLYIVTYTLHVGHTVDFSGIQMNGGVLWTSLSDLSVKSCKELPLFLFILPVYRICLLILPLILVEFFFCLFVFSTYMCYFFLIAVFLLLLFYTSGRRSLMERAVSRWHFYKTLWHSLLSQWLTMRFSSSSYRGFQHFKFIIKGVVIFGFHNENHLNSFLI